MIDLRHEHPQVLAVGCGYLAFGAALMVLMAPWPSMPVHHVEGLAAPAYSRGRFTTDEGILVHGVRLGCTQSIFGTQLQCRVVYRQDAPVRAVYATHKALLARLGLYAPSHLLLRLEQQGTVLFQQGLETYRRDFLVSSWPVFGLYAFGLPAVLRGARRRLLAP